MSAAEPDVLDIADDLQNAPTDPHVHLKQLDVVQDSAYFDERLTAFFDANNVEAWIAGSRDHVCDLMEVR